jgi:TetR/AcrR family transcriptional repressor of mexJK operon
VSVEASAVRKKVESDRRAAIIGIARPIFLSEGYAATSMSAIAVRVGGSKATLYSYFPSKEALFIAVIESACDEVLSSVYGDTPESMDLRETLSLVGGRFLSFGLSDEAIAIYRLASSESVRFPVIGQTLNESGFARGVERLAKYFERMMAAGLLRKSDPIIAAEQFFDLCGAGILHRRLWNVSLKPSEAEIAAQVERATETFVRAFAGRSN